MDSRDLAAKCAAALGASKLIYIADVAQVEDTVTGDRVPPNNTVPSNETVPPNDTVLPNDTVPPNDSIPPNDSVPPTNNGLYHITKTVVAVVLNTWYGDATHFEAINSALDYLLRRGGGGFP